MKKKYLIKYGYTDVNFGLFECSEEVWVSDLSHVYEEMGHICYAYLSRKRCVLNYINYELIEEE